MTNEKSKPQNATVENVAGQAALERGLNSRAEMTGETRLAFIDGFTEAWNEAIKFSGCGSQPTAQALRRALEMTSQASRKALEVIKQENFVFNHQGDRWEKLAFTLYTRLVQISTDAKQALEEAALAETASD